MAISPAVVGPIGCGSGEPQPMGPNRLPAEEARPETLWQVSTRFLLGSKLEPSRAWLPRTLPGKFPGVFAGPAWGAPEGPRLLAARHGRDGRRAGGPVKRAPGPAGGRGPDHGNEKARVRVPRRGPWFVFRLGHHSDPAAWPKTRRAAKPEFLHRRADAGREPLRDVNPALDRAALLPQLRSTTQEPGQLRGADPQACGGIPERQHARRAGAGQFGAPCLHRPDRVFERVLAETLDDREPPARVERLLRSRGRCRWHRSDPEQGLRITGLAPPLGRRATPADRLEVGFSSGARPGSVRGREPVVRRSGIAARGPGGTPAGVGLRSASRRHLLHLRAGRHGPDDRRPWHITRPGAQNRLVQRQQRR